MDNATFKQVEKALARKGETFDPNNPEHVGLLTYTAMAKAKGLKPTAVQSVKKKVKTETRDWEAGLTLGLIFDSDQAFEWMTLTSEGREANLYGERIAVNMEEDSVRDVVKLAYVNQNIAVWQAFRNDILKLKDEKESLRGHIEVDRNLFPIQLNELDTTATTALQTLKYERETLLDAMHKRLSLRPDEPLEKYYGVPVEEVLPGQLEQYLAEQNLAEREIAVIGAHVVESVHSALKRIPVVGDTRAYVYAPRVYVDLLRNAGYYQLGSKGNVFIGAGLQGSLDFVLHYMNLRGPLATREQRKAQFAYEVHAALMVQRDYQIEQEAVRARLLEISNTLEEMYEKLRAGESHVKTLEVVEARQLSQDHTDKIYMQQGNTVDRIVIKGLEQERDLLLLVQDKNYDPVKYQQDIDKFLKDLARLYPEDAGTLEKIAATFKAAVQPAGEKYREMVVAEAAQTIAVTDPVMTELPREMLLADAAALSGLMGEFAEADKAAAGDSEEAVVARMRTGAQKLAEKYGGYQERDRAGLQKQADVLRWNYDSPSVLTYSLIGGYSWDFGGLSGVVTGAGLSGTIGLTANVINFASKNEKAQRAYAQQQADSIEAAGEEQLEDKRFAAFLAVAEKERLLEAAQASLADRVAGYRDQLKTKAHGVYDGEKQIHVERARIGVLKAQSQVAFAEKAVIEAMLELRGLLNVTGEKKISELPEKAAVAAVKKAQTEEDAQLQQAGISKTDLLAPTGSMTHRE